MIQIGKIFKSAQVLSRHTISSKKRVLELLSELAVSNETEIAQNEVFESLFDRERLGSTGLGNGVAIPHGRVKGLDHTIAVFIKLNVGVDYDAIDGKPVNLICALLVPEESTEEHLVLLSQLAELFSDAAMCQQLRNAKTNEAVFTLLSNWQKS